MVNVGMSFQLHGTYALVDGDRGRSSAAPWDPFGIWPKGRRYIWAFLSVLILGLQGPAFLRSLRPPPAAGVDFFQDWAAARNLLNGDSPYGDILDAAQVYLGRGANPVAGIASPAHPPTAVLVVTPFALLDYPEAMVVWNLVSLALFVCAVGLLLRGLSLRLPLLAILPALALLLISPPFRMQVNQGQFNLLLLALLVGGWYAVGAERPVLGGALLGSAAALKLFPALLLIHYALRREWKVAIAGTSMMVMLMAISAVIVGLESTNDFLTRVLPSVDSFKAGWRNVSIHGFWWKLFFPGLELLDAARASPELSRVSINPPLRSPAVASWASLVSVLVILVVWGRHILKGMGRVPADVQLALTLVVMVLVSPVAWLHYLVLLIPSFVFLWTRLSASRRQRYALLLLLLAVMGPVWELLLPPGSDPLSFAWPGVVTTLSIPTWGMIGLLLFILFLPQPAPAD